MKHRVHVETTVPSSPGQSKIANKLLNKSSRNGRKQPEQEHRKLLIFRKKLNQPQPSVELITQRSKVQILPPQPRIQKKFTSKRF